MNLEIIHISVIAIIKEIIIVIFFAFNDNEYFMFEKIKKEEDKKVSRKRENAEKRS